MRAGCKGVLVVVVTCITTKQTFPAHTRVSTHCLRHYSGEGGRDIHHHFIPLVVRCEAKGGAFRGVDRDGGGEGELEVRGKEVIDVVVGTRDTLTQLPCWCGWRSEIARLYIVGGRGSEKGLHFFEIWPEPW